jgi:hypothetical protein
MRTALISAAYMGLAAAAAVAALVAALSLVAISRTGGLINRSYRDQAVLVRVSGPTGAKTTPGLSELNGRVRHQG